MSLEYRANGGAEAWVGKENLLLRKVLSVASGHSSPEFVLQITFTIPGRAPWHILSPCLVIMSYHVSEAGTR